MNDNVATMAEVSDNDFAQTVLQSEQPVLVDFWAPWCRPCLMVAPIVEEVARDYAGKIEVCKMEVDGNPQTPALYGVRGIPTLILFRGGKVLDARSGTLSRTDLSQFIDEALQRP